MAFKRSVVFEGDSLIDRAVVSFYIYRIDDKDNIFRYKKEVTFDLLAHMERPKIYEQIVNECDNNIHTFGSATTGIVAWNQLMADLSLKYRCEYITPTNNKFLYDDSILSKLLELKRTMEKIRDKYIRHPQFNNDNFKILNEYYNDVDAYEKEYIKTGLISKKRLHEMNMMYKHIKNLNWY